VLIVAGPNGAGKTTYAREVLAFDRELEFANADEIAARLRPDDPSAVALEAGRRLLDLIDSLVAADRSFLLETTLSGRTYAKRIHDEKGKAWSKRGPGTVIKGPRADDKFIVRAINDNANMVGEKIAAELRKVEL
jgi:hypothetical protein